MLAGYLGQPPLRRTGGRSRVAPPRSARPNRMSSKGILPYSVRRFASIGRYRGASGLFIARLQIDRNLQSRKWNVVRSRKLIQVIILTPTNGGRFAFEEKGKRSTLHLACMRELLRSADGNCQICRGMTADNSC
jgi:hypothetical protein